MDQEFSYEEGGGPLALLSKRKRPPNKPQRFRKPLRYKVNPALPAVYTQKPQFFLKL